jgi:hypothetical protein
MTFAKNWEITMIELQNSIGKKYKVTRRLPEFLISETMMFRSKESAKKQLDEWIMLQ